MNIDIDILYNKKSFYLPSTMQDFWILLTLLSCSTCTPLLVTFELVEDLLCSRIIVSNRIVRIAVLVKDHRVRDLIHQLLSYSNVRL